MDERAYVLLEVALEIGGGDTICGTVAARGGPATPFTGWLELMSAFDRARARPATGDEAASSASGG
jgi:hypothetical protein